MYLTNHQTSLLTLLTLFLSSTHATPVELNHQPRTQRKHPESLLYWTEPNFALSGWLESPDEAQLDRGSCFTMQGPNAAQSAQAPVGYKCTIYSDKGCHGWRTREFNQDGIVDLGAKMNRNGEAWRCCRIGTRNGWGYCDEKLNGGTE